MSAKLILKDRDMKVGDRVKTKNEPWSPLDSWTIEKIDDDRVHLVRYEGCGMSATVRSIDTLELIDDYFSKRNIKIGESNSR